MTDFDEFDGFEEEFSFNSGDDSGLPYAQCIAAGLRVFPLHPIHEMGGHTLGCGCGDPECVALGKHPAAASWQHTPIWDDEQIATMRMFGQLHPAYGVLVRDGLLVVDVDERNGGHESIQRLEQVTGCDIRGAAGFVVRTGSGGESAHYYFRLTDADVGGSYRQGLPEYPGIDFKNTGYVVGYGSPHVSGLNYELLSGNPGLIGAPPKELLDRIRQRGMFSGVAQGVVRDVSLSDLREIARAINVAALTYYEWVSVGMALHHTTGGGVDGLAIWDEISQSDTREKHGYKPGDCARRWHRLGKSKHVVTLGTLLMIAQRFGYVESVTYVPDVDFGDLDALVSADSGGGVIVGVNDSGGAEVGDGVVTKTALAQPRPNAIQSLSAGIQPWDMPGFAGTLYQWIDGQCRYPRRTIAAGAVLYVLSCLGGMRHIDERDGMGMNMMIFAIAGTGTGKESIFQAITTLFSKAGITPAMHGKIKSEQEIFRNLLRHQAAFYAIDEIGIMLKKIAQASKGTGAVYLTGVIGAIMEVYSKATGILTITGDLKEEIKESLKAEASKVNKKLDAGDGVRAELDAEIERLKKALNDADKGIVSPYLTMYGTTTPETFNECITPENVQNGFIARALILRESETNPRWRTGFKTAPLPNMVEMRLASLYHGGEFDASKRATTRIQSVGDPTPITTTAEASELLDEAQEVFWQLGEHHKACTGMEGITRRAWEMCSKISLVLAMADGGVRTADHVLYGFAMARADTGLKIQFARSNDERDIAAPTQKVLSMLSRDTPTPRWKINRALKNNSEGSQGMIDALEVAGKIVVVKDKATNGNVRESILLA